MFDGTLKTIKTITGKCYTYNFDQLDEEIGEIIYGFATKKLFSPEKCTHPDMEKLREFLEYQSYSTNLASSDCRQ